MINIDESIADRVRETFSVCFDRDMDNKDRFDPSDPKRYIVPFEIYRDGYSLVEQLGVRIIDPRELSYPLGRNGECTHFTLHMMKLLSSPLDLDELIKMILGLPTIETPTDGCLVVYYESLPEAPRLLGNPTHSGFFVNGRVISKWGLGGPIFEHEVSAMPYFGFSTNISGREFSHNHWAEFKSQN